MKIIKTILVILTTFLFTSCNKKNTVIFDNTLIEKMSNEDATLPSQYSMFNLYVKCKNNLITQTNIQQLKGFYKKSDRTKTFKVYLQEVLNQKMIVDESRDIDCFTLDNEVTQEYGKGNFKNFLETYFDKKENCFRLKSGIDGNKRETIFYYTFLHNYLATFDDYIGYYYLVKSSEL